jgi:CRISPR-associated endonuclease/helicase Cas3
LGRIVLSTQAVEAGIDVDAAVVFTEAAPWPSVLRRAALCDSIGPGDGELWWLPPGSPPPYERADIEASIAELVWLEGVALTGEELGDRDVAVAPPAIAELRRAELTALFDTALERGGEDVDVEPYVGDADDTEAQVAWATWKSSVDDGGPPADAGAPGEQWRCRVPLGGVAELLRHGAAIWRIDPSLDRWAKVADGNPPRPGEVLVVAASDGGYNPVSGFDGAVRAPVADCPVMRSQAELAALRAEAPGSESADEAPSVWTTLDRHSEEVRDQAADLLAALRPGVSRHALDAVVLAAYAHDAGKAHPTWQDALCRLAPVELADEIARGRPWAKSASSEPLEFDGAVRFRHEFASLLLLFDGPLSAVLAGVAEPDLVKYLVLAHHGRLRMQVRDPADTDLGVLLGLRHGAIYQIPPLLGFPGSELKVDLDQFARGGERSWVRTALGLRDRYGPFVLAYLETVVRVADWRASAGLENAE